MAKLYYWKGKENAGDYFAYWLAKKLYKHVEYSADNANLVITGSILATKALSNKTTVWGAGWHNCAGDHVCQIKNKDNFLAVRGKLTAEKLGLDLNSVVLGDPGLLASKYFVPGEIEKTDITIVCHWRDYDRINKAYGSKYNVVSMQTNDVEYILTQIYNSKLVLSTSLHGLIFAHSYGIPAVHIVCNQLESIGNFKFKDYYSSFNGDYTSYKLNFETDVQAFNQFFINRSKYVVDLAKINEIQNKLLAVKPAESKLYKDSICLGAIAKNENNYIREWVAHYKKLGFDKIFLYDNNDIDGEHFEDVINDYIESGFVELINVRGLSNQQITRYNELYHTKAKAYKWVAFFDIDEFLHLDNNLTIKQFISQSKFNQFDCIAVNWKYFDDNNLIKVVDNNYSIKRFTHEFKENDWVYAQHRFSKRIVRTNIPNVLINSSHGPIAKAQMSEYNTDFRNTLKACNIAGQPLSINHLIVKEWTYDGGYLAHYRFKTIDEYISCKMKRGYPTLYKDSGKGMNIDDFFALNNKTVEKLNYIRETYGIGEKSNQVIEKQTKPTTQIKPASKPKINTKKKADGRDDSYLYF